jgi:glycosyltransferase involved in cell wall biosynthesis
MKIAIIDPSLFTAPYDEALCAALQAQGHDVTLYARPRYNDEPAPHPDVCCEPLFYSFAKAVQGTYEPIRLTIKAADHVSSCLRLLNRLSEARPDVIHFQWTPIPAVDRLFLAHFARLAPLVLTVHDTRPFNDRPSSPLQRLAANTIYPLFDRLIVHTQIGKGRLCEAGVNPGKIHRIAHGALVSDGLTPNAIVLPPPVQNAVTVLLIGKLKPYKGADVLIRAVKLIPEPVRRRARFVVAGKPYMDVDELYALCEEEDVVSAFDFDLRFLPEESLTQYLARASIFVFPYRDIEASGVLFAALRWGRPIVASALGAFSELLRDGIHGHLVPPDDPPALARALTKLILDRTTRIQMGRAAAALHDTIPSWDRIARETAALYRRAGLWPEAPGPSNTLVSAA